MTEYLIFYGVWHIAIPGAIKDHAHKDKPIRLAWFERDGKFICFDYNEPEVKGPLEHA